MGEDLAGRAVAEKELGPRLQLRLAAADQGVGVGGHGEHRVVGGDLHPLGPGELLEMPAEDVGADARALI